MANIDRQTGKSRSTGVARSRQGAQAARRGSFEPLLLNPGEFFNNPFSVMRRMHEEMDRMFSEAFSSRSTAGSAQAGPMGGWSPVIEVSERDQQIKVCAELPGLKPEDVKVEVTDGALVIEGERKQEQEGKEGSRWHSERRYGQFYRTIPLPDEADTESARADFKNGELQVTIPVRPTENKRRQIPINGTTAQAQPSA